MATDASTKVAPVAAPAAPAKPAQAAKPAAPATPSTPSSSPNQRSPEQVQTQSRTERIKAAVETARQKAEAAKAAEKPATDTPAKPADVPSKPVEKTATDTPVEPPTVIKAEKKADAAPTTEPDPIDQWTLPANASAEAVKNFADIRTEAKLRKQREAEALKKAADLEAQLTTFRNAAPADTAAVETLKSQLKEAHDRLAIFDLKSHPDFVKQFVTPMTVALAEAQEVMGWNTKEGDTAPDLSKLISLPPKELNAEISKITKDMNSADAAVIMNSLRNAHKLNAQQQEALSKSGELNTRLQQQAAQQSKAAFEEVSKTLGVGGSDFLQPLEIVDGLSPEDKKAAEEYNASLGTVRTNAEKIAFGAIDAKGVATIAYKASTLDHMLQHTIPRVQAEFRKLATLCKEQADVIKQLRGGGTGAADLSGSGSGSSGGPDVSKMTVQERVRYRLSEAKRSQQR